ncbi:MAG: NAD(P)/FAD-dependent oxidoreductase [Mycobacteriales bacterium]
MTGPLWDDGQWSGLPRLEEDVTADVCVVGLGGSGLTAVHELRARGASVVGIDAGTVGCGAAGRNGGFLLAGPALPYHRQRNPLLYRQTLEELDRMEAAGFLRRTGSLRIERSAEGLADCDAHARALREDGFTVHDYSGPEGTGLLFPRDGVCHPLARCRMLATGPGLFESTPALSVATGLVETPRGRVSCEHVLVLVDGRLEQLLPEVPVRTVRLQMLGTSAVPQRFSRPVYLRDGYEYWQQLPDGRLVLGGFRDLGGQEEETTSTETSATVQGALEELLARVAPGAVVTHRWAASVGYTQDALPYLGEVRQGVWAAGGYCGTGNVIGALCARQLVTNVLGGPTFMAEGGGGVTWAGGGRRRRGGRSRRWRRCS